MGGWWVPWVRAGSEHVSPCQCIGVTQLGFCIKKKSHGFRGSSKIPEELLEESGIDPAPLVLPNRWRCGLCTLHNQHCGLFMQEEVGLETWARFCRGSLSTVITIVSSVCSSCGTDKKNHYITFLLEFFFNSDKRIEGKRTSLLY